MHDSQKTASPTKNLKGLWSSVISWRSRRQKRRPHPEQAPYLAWTIQAANRCLQVLPLRRWSSQGQLSAGATSLSDDLSVPFVCSTYTV